MLFHDKHGRPPMKQGTPPYFMIGMIGTKTHGKTTHGFHSFHQASPHSLAYGPRAHEQRSPSRSEKRSFGRARRSTPGVSTAIPVET